MSRKPKDVVLARLKTPADWDAYLASTYGYARVNRSDREVSEHRIINRENGKPLSLEKIAELYSVNSDLAHGMQRDTLLRETAADETIELTSEWARYFGLMSLFADALLPKDKRSYAKEMLVAQCCSGTALREAPPRMPSELGTPQELRGRWRRHEVDIRAAPPSNRREYVIEVTLNPIPPDANDDEDGEGRE